MIRDRAFMRIAREAEMDESDEGRRMSDDRIFRWDFLEAILDVRYSFIQIVIIRNTCFLIVFICDFRC